MRSQEIRRFIVEQFEEDQSQQELRFLGGSLDYDWIERTRSTIEHFCGIAPDLADYVVDKVPSRLNSGIILDELIKDILRNDRLPNSYDLVNELDKYSTVVRELTSNLESQQVSAEIQRQVEKFSGFSGKIYSNGNSIFPDFVYRHLDYTKLPMQNRKKTVHGPCLQGKKNPRPSNVPDGIELKTNRGTKMKIDAHARHCGLHIGFTWDFTPNGLVEINGAWAGYIAEGYHRESARNSETTTVKYSFGHDRFISLL